MPRNSIYTITGSFLFVVTVIMPCKAADQTKSEWIQCEPENKWITYNVPVPEEGTILNLNVVPDLHNNCHVFWKTEGEETENLTHAVFNIKNQGTKKLFQTTCLAKEKSISYTVSPTTDGITVIYADWDNRSFIMRSWSETRRAWNEAVKGPTFHDSPSSTFFYLPKHKMLIWNCSRPVPIDVKVPQDKPAEKMKQEYLHKVMSKIHQSRNMLKGCQLIDSENMLWSKPFTVLSGEDGAPEYNADYVFKNANNTLSIFAEAKPSSKEIKKEFRCYVYDIMSKKSMKKSPWTSSYDSLLFHVFPLPGKDIYYLLWDEFEDPQTGKPQLNWSRSDMPGEKNIPTRQLNANWGVIGNPIAAFREDKYHGVHGIAVFMSMTEKFKRYVMAAKYINGKWSTPANLPFRSSVDNIILTEQNKDYFVDVSRREIRLIPFEIQWGDGSPR